MDPFREVRTPERNFGPAKLGSGAVVTPLARRLAGERGIDLSRVTGSGPHGRIVARDVEQAAPGAAPCCDGERCHAAQVKALYDGIAYEEVPLDGMRRTIATRLVEAKQTIPHFYLTADVDAGRLIAMREEANAAAPKNKDGQPAFKLSVNDFVIKAWALALQRVPAANAVWAGRPHPAFPAFRYRRRGRARRRADHAGDPQRRAEVAHRDLGGDARSCRARARTKSSGRTNIRAAPARSPISACMACANSRRSSIRRTPPSWRSAQRGARRSRPRMAV